MRGRLKRDDVAAAQAAYVAVGECLPAFGEDHVLFARFDVGDVYLWAVPELFEVFGKELGTIVVGQTTDGVSIVGERRLDDHHIQPLVHVQALPETVVGGGVAAEGDHAPGAGDTVTDRRHGVHDGNHLESASFQRDALARLHDLVLQHGSQRRGQLVEIGPG